MDSIEKMMEQSEIGCAKHKMIFNEEGKPVDYCFLFVNPSFERLTGLKREELLNRRVSEVMPNIIDDVFDWIGYYGKVVTEGQKRVFEQYSAPLDKWYRVEALSCEKDYFMTLFTDISHERELAEASKAFLNDGQKTNTFEQMTQRMKQITGADYVALNIFLEDGESFRTEAIAGIPSALQKAASLLGFNPLKKKWPPDPRRMELIRENTVTTFDRLHELTSHVISKTAIQLVEKTFNLGQTVIIKSTKGGRIIGDFTLMFSKGKTLQNEYEAVIYADMVGMLIENRKGLQKLAEKETTLQKAKDDLQTISDNMLDLVSVTDLEGNYKFAGASHKILGYDTDDLIGRNVMDFVHPDDFQEVQTKFAEFIRQKTKTGKAIYRNRCVDGSYLWFETIGTTILDKDGEPKEILFNTRNITEQKRLENALRKNELKFRTLFETMAQGVVYHDDKGRIITANPTAENILGLPLNQMHGRTSADPIWKAIDKDGKPLPGEEHPVMVSLQNSQPVYGKVMGVFNPKEERFHWLKVNTIPEYRQGEEKPYQVYATFEDITNEIDSQLILKENQKQLKIILQETNKQKQHLEAMHEIAVDVLNSTDFLETATKLFNDCKRLTGATSGYVALLNDAGDENEVLYLDSGGDNCTVDPALPMPIRGLRGIAYHTGEVEYHNDFMHSKHWQYMPKGHVDLKNVLFAPLKNQKEVIGLIGLGNKEGGFTEEDAKTAKTIAKFVSLTLQKSQLITQLTQERKKAEEANQAKSMFLANMNHELRTPLNGIIGFTDILRNTPLNKEQHEYADIVYTSGKYLADIISDILDLSRIEAGKFELNSKKTDLKDLVEKTLSLVRPKAKEKGLTLCASIENDVPGTIEVDGSRLRQVLINLIANAVKFTDKGSVHISVSLREKHPNKARLLFKVTDTGMGIKQEEQAKIFEPFQQANMSTDKKAQGTGLGLAISKKMLELMGGSLELESVFGEGSTFYFELLLPCEQEKTVFSEEEDPESMDEQAVFTNKKILIAEDNPINMHYVQAAIAMFSKDTRIIRARDGKEAYHLYREHQPDLILMDIRMPHVDGYHATAMIRQHDKQIPIIAMTAKAFQEDKEKCLSAGMNEYLTKPVSLEQLKEALIKYL